MANFIFDLNDNPLDSAQLAVIVGQSESAQIRIECRAGYRFYSETIGDLTVEAKRVADASFVDIEGSGIDLTAWAGTRQNFDVKITSTGAIRERKVFNLLVSL